ncbi:hypothetical protein B0H19DRAFT_1325621 [Mycena capillaripes]|nr:hypothetical protein B0H19DRAFT_1325621 [Mycena capillaripes]
MYMNGAAPPLPRLKAYCVRQKARLEATVHESMLRCQLLQMSYPPSAGRLRPRRSSECNQSVAIARPPSGPSPWLRCGIHPMPRSNPPAQHPQRSTPSALKRRRTIMACLCCRTRKIRCITSEQPPRNPCARCTKKGLACEYVAASEMDCYPSSSSSSSSSSPRTPNLLGWDIPTLPAPKNSWTPLPPSPNLISHDKCIAVSPIPYTIPPAHDSQLLYAGAQYTDFAPCDLDCVTSMPVSPYYPSDCFVQPNTNYAAYDFQAVHAPQYPAVYPTPLHPSYAGEPHSKQYPVPLPMPFFTEIHNGFDWQQELGRE